MDHHEQRRDSGFTLLELLVVIVILGVLATVVVFAVGGIVDRGEVSALESDERTIETAEESHFALHGEYATEPDLVSAGLMREESDLHDITVTPDGRDYTIAPTADGGDGGDGGDSSDDGGDGGDSSDDGGGPPPPPPPTGFAEFNGQVSGSGTKTLVIIGRNGAAGASTQQLWDDLTADPLPDTIVIWLDQGDVDDTDDIDDIIDAGATYMVAADSMPIARMFSPFGTTFVGQYMDVTLNSPGGYWWTHDQGRNPTRAELAARLGVPGS